MRGASWTGLEPAQVAWALYDLAYSAFSFLLLIRFFPTWIINDLNRPDWYVSMTQLAVVVLVVLLMPVAGTLADQLGRRKPFLAAFTLGGAAFAIALGLLPVGDNVLPLLVVAGAAAACGQLAFAQYDPLLADVAAPPVRGRVSGLAVALGFAGTILALAVVAQLIVGDGSKQRAFVPAGIAFAVFALPVLALVREREREEPRRPVSLRRAVAQVAASLRQVGAHRPAFQFLAGRFLYSDAITTLSAFITVYMTRLGGFSESEKNAVLGIAVVTAGAAALAAGRVVEHLGPRRPLLAVLPVFSACVLLAAATGQAWTLWLVSPAAGTALGVVWTADRVFMLLLTPPAVRGQFFGFFNLANRVASAFGPLVVWSGTIWLLHGATGWLSALGASRVALVGLAAVTLAGWAVIRPLSDERTAPEPRPAAGPLRSAH